MAVLSAVLLPAGCNQTAMQSAGGDKYFLTTDFEEGQTFRYKFVSTRDIVVDYKGGESKGNSDKAVQEYGESLEMVFSYTPVEVDPYGDTKIEAVCESVKSSTQAGRNSSGEAIKFFEGKQFTFSVDPAGKITKDSEMRELVKEASKEVFTESSQGRIKTPDMIYDFIVSQWTLWDSISSIDKPLDGVSEGQSWDSQILICAPMVIRKAAKIKYTLDSVAAGEQGETAVINSLFTSAETVSEDWVVPYKGSFRMKGTFGFLRNYKLESLEGEGKDVFDIDKGLVRKRVYDYTARFGASLMFPIGGSSPSVTVEQHYEMELL